jgi:hypothetical protein
MPRIVRASAVQDPISHGLSLRGVLALSRIAAISDGGIKGQIARYATTPAAAMEKPFENQRSRP